MTDTDLDLWIKQLWEDIPPKLCPSGSRGSKPEFVTACKKVTARKGETIEETRKYITLKTLQKARCDMAKYKAGQKFTTWQHACRHIKHKRYDDDFNVVQDKPNEKSSQTCSTHGCTYAIACMDKCAKCHTEAVKHLDPLREKKIETWKRLELSRKKDESSEEYIKRMKDIAIQKARNIGKL